MCELLIELLPGRLVLSWDILWSYLDIWMISVWGEALFAWSSKWLMSLESSFKLSYSLFPKLSPVFSSNSISRWCYLFWYPPSILGLFEPIISLAACTTSWFESGGCQFDSYYNTIYCCILSRFFMVFRFWSLPWHAFDSSTIQSLSGFIVL